MGLRLTRDAQEAVDRLMAEGMAVEGPKARMGDPGTTEGLPPTLSEKAFMAKVVALAKENGWKIYHTLNSRGSQPGFPDLVLVRQRVLFIELKTEKGKPTDEQREWIIALKLAGAEVQIWRPSMWNDIVRTLKSPGESGES